MNWRRHFSSKHQHLCRAWLSVIILRQRKRRILRSWPESLRRTVMSTVRYRLHRKKWSRSVKQARTETLAWYLIIVFCPRRTFWRMSRSSTSRSHLSSQMHQTWRKERFLTDMMNMIRPSCCWREVFQRLSSISRPWAPKKSFWAWALMKRV